jgi:hypothetical protein
MHAAAALRQPARLQVPARMLRMRFVVQTIYGGLPQKDCRIAARTSSTARA